MAAVVGIQQQLNNLKRDMNNVSLKQLPYATRLTVNKLAENAKKNFELKEIPRLDRPTRYAQNMMRVVYANRSNLTSKSLFTTLCTTSGKSKYFL